MADWEERFDDYVGRLARIIHETGAAAGGAAPAAAAVRHPRATAAAIMAAELAGAWAELPMASVSTSPARLH